MSSRSNRLNTRDISKKDIIDSDRKKEAKEWVRLVFEKNDKDKDNPFYSDDMQNMDLFDALQDGTVLCELLNRIRPGTCKKKYKKTKIMFVAMSNIQIFLKGAKSFGVPQTELFDSSDLYEKKRLSAVLQCLYAVSGKTRDMDGFDGPYIGVVYAKANKRLFSQEILNKSKSSVPKFHKTVKHTKDNSFHDHYGIVKGKFESPSAVQSVWSIGSKQIDNNNMDAYGIVKTDKDMQRPSNVQGVWQTGSKEMNNKNIDAYGIVKTDKDMQNPSNVQGVWSQGAKEMNNKNIDAYGIVKTDKDMQRPSNVQGVWHTGAKSHHTKNMDSYGIIKMDNDDHVHSEVQSVWQQGSNSITDNSSKHDSYGIVKVQDMQKQNEVQGVLQKGSKCQIYSESNKKWFDGSIIKITIDDEGEWLLVGYRTDDKEERTQEIQRSSKSIRPIEEEINKNQDSY